jgi:hypothetical protein
VSTAGNKGWSGAAWASHPPRGGARAAEGAAVKTWAVGCPLAYSRFVCLLEAHGSERPAPRRRPRGELAWLWHAEPAGTADDRSQGDSSATLSGCQLPLSATHAESLGARFWGQVRGSSGRLRVLQGKGAAKRETSQIAGNAPYQARFPYHIEAGHGKEGVDGSSPSEGFAKLAAHRPLPFAIRTMNRILDVHRTSTQLGNDPSIAAETST